jgi:ubiquinol-cytochrome c reductase cytochrome b subunit
LGRAFAFHISLLPMILVALIVVHLYLVRRTGVSVPPSASPEQATQVRHFFPGFVLEDLAVLFGILSVFSAVLFFAPYLYLPPEAFEKADPFLTPSHVKPEWYFLASYELLRLIPNKTIGILAQIFAVAVLVLLPFLDRGPRRPIYRRPVFLGIVCLGVGALVALTVLGALA